MKLDNKIVVGLLVTILLVVSSFTLVVNAFDPGGPPAGGGIPRVVTGNWEWINYQPTGGSYSPQFDINKDNVQYLEMNWIFPYVNQDAEALGFNLAAQTGSSAPALFVDGIIYIAKNDKSVHAIDAETGAEIWFNDELSKNPDFNTLVAEFPYLQGSRGHIHAMNYYRQFGWLIMSSIPCWLAATNIEDGSLAWSMGPEILCGTNEELGNPAQGIMGTFKSKGYFPSISNHPPSFYGDIMVWPSMGASGAGGRSSIIGFDMSNPDNPKQLWRTWVAPAMDGSQKDWAIEQCDITGGNGWYFEFPRYRETGQLALNCKDAPEDAVMNDWINMKPNTPHYGEVHTASAVSPVWGNMPIDPETGIIYLGTGDIGPYPNSTFKFGPNLHGSGIIAIDSATGELVWWFATNPHDLWDMDCSWGGIIGKSAGTKVLIKACKNGIVYALDAATGEPVWVYDPPNIRRDVEMNYGVDMNNDPTGKDACCNMVFEHMNKDWMHQPKDTPVRTICYTHCIESDIAYDGKHVYFAAHNAPRNLTINNVRDFGNNGQAVYYGAEERNVTVFAVDVHTGETAWEFFIEPGAFRGGILVTGGVVYAYASDGNLYMLDSDTGELLSKKFFGIPVNVAPTVGAGDDGKHRIGLHVGGGGGFVFRGHGTAPGIFSTFGLPDTLPEPIVRIEDIERIVEVRVEGPERIIEIEKEVQVIKEVEVEKIVEVEVEKIVEVEVEKPVEVEVVVTEEVVSPISYIAIGLGVVLVVIAGVLYQRSKA